MSDKITIVSSVLNALELRFPQLIPQDPDFYTLTKDWEPVDFES